MYVCHCSRPVRCIKRYITTHATARWCHKKLRVVCTTNISPNILAYQKNHHHSKSKRKKRLSYLQKASKFQTHDADVPAISIDPIVNATSTANSIPEKNADRPIMGMSVRDPISEHYEFDVDVCIRNFRYTFIPVLRKSTLSIMEHHYSIPYCQNASIVQHISWTPRCVPWPLIRADFGTWNAWCWRRQSATCHAHTPKKLTD